MTGFNYRFEKANLVTIWSAPNYCGRCDNLASIMNVDENLERFFEILVETDEDAEKRVIARKNKVFPKVRN